MSSCPYLPHKQLGLAEGIIAVALNARDERVGAFKRSTVKSLPFEVLFPREVMPELFHGHSPRSVRADGNCAYHCQNRP